MEVDVLSTFRQLRRLAELASHYGSSAGEGLRSKTSAAEPRSLRGRLHVWQDTAGATDPLLSGEMPPPTPKDGHILLRSVSESVRAGAADSGDEGSGDADEGGIQSQTR